MGVGVAAVAATRTKIRGRGAVLEEIPAGGGAVRAEVVEIMSRGVVVGTRVGGVTRVAVVVGTSSRAEAMVVGTNRGAEAVATVTNRAIVK